MPFSGGRAVPWGEMDGRTYIHDKTISCISQFRERASSFSLTWVFKIDFQIYYHAKRFYTFVCIWNIYKICTMQRIQRLPCYANISFFSVGINFWHFHCRIFWWLTLTLTCCTLPFVSSLSKSIFLIPLTDYGAYHWYFQSRFSETSPISQIKKYTLFSIRTCILE